MSDYANSCQSSEPENRDTPQQQIIEMGSTVVKNKRGTIHCLTIIGQVEGHTTLPPNVKTTKYEHVLPLLASVEEKDDVDGLLLLLNTVGGDIEASRWSHWCWAAATPSACRWRCAARPPSSCPARP